MDKGVCVIILFVRVARAAVVLFYRRWLNNNEVGLFNHKTAQPWTMFINLLFGLIGIGCDAKGI